MKFIDEAVIIVQSGDGGNGCISFRREKFIARGGPDGGDGGKGGNVILKATHRKRTLLDFQFNKQFKAKNGGHGQGQQKTGKTEPVSPSMSRREYRPSWDRMDAVKAISLMLCDG